MKKVKKVFKFMIVFILLLTAFMYLNNSSLFVQEEEGEPILLAHRGLAQTFPMEGITGETCTAEMIYDPEHPYLENTIPSMEAAFEEGADIVEIDIHPTIDGEFAVFHDWTLDCRTDGTGTTRDHSMEELKALDVGYGYTADNGETYPFRGKGIGLMPTLNEVLTHFPDKEFLIHIKSNDPAEGEQLADYLDEYTEERKADLSVYGGDEPVLALKEKLPELRVMSKQTLKSCLLSYEAISWTGYIPDACKNTQLHLPEKYASYIWGYPGKFLNRMEGVNTRVILVAGEGEWSEGFDQESDLQRIPEDYDGGLWTNRIDRIAPLIKE
ncbi:glycerophosphodiester phosphodiesterase family protein [Jeotgalibacillus haloalkalitolerans]|uniref:Glycerophosphodiester phosphodiesterase family protein n=1 Tax=Jeotgalibacillus haloalkalitolerans TaxID=3104292 RepID=A0ABU5KPG0_9BACL|nr:glycerophosphodiester phosphodiesterase family protein [Jeotgalibacillus sp. HH7-29]MDZ5712590.1 glycerophosphodiester phosphodiesterase family protein [Jeotgalibacillus sp. HH7-29]